jgi:sulfoxide reductase heme-binding subunit YedZ
MSENSVAEKAPVRERVNPRRAPSTHAMKKTPWPWHDRSGRFSRLKTGVLVLEIVPAVWIAFALATDQLGARPITEAIHQTGLWTIRFLMISLMASPARAIFNWHRLVLVRRQLGLTALFYGLAHLTLYVVDENWRMATVAMEILDRFYLAVGFTALVGLSVLGVTSTDRALRTLGHGWKRLHRIIYALAVLATLHFFLQSKADVAEATLMAGIFFWMMGWRLLPSGPDRSPLPILGLGVAAALLTAVVEYAWYGFETRIDPIKPLLAELDISYGPHPAGQVLLIGICFAIATGLFWARNRSQLRDTLGFNVALYAGGAVITAALAFAFSLTDDWLPDNWEFWQVAIAFIAGAAVLGGLRRALRRPLVLDWVCGAVLLAPLLAGLAI